MGSQWESMGRAAYAATPERPKEVPAESLARELLKLITSR